jgi:hypothetical protein
MPAPPGWWRRDWGSHWAAVQEPYSRRAARGAPLNRLPSLKSVSLLH